MIRFAKKIVDKNTIEEQIRHIQSEIGEVMAEISETIDYNKLTEEIIDLQTSCETAKQILRIKHNVNVGLIERNVIEKNEKRGYYDGNELDKI